LLSSRTELQEILSLAPDWQPVLDSVVSKAAGDGKDVSTYQLFERLGAKAIYMKASALGGQRLILNKLLRDHYYQPMIAKMFGNNQNLKRFWAQRKHPFDWQKGQAISMAVELSTKMEGVLERHLTNKSADGFKVLLPAYVQRSVQNAVVDYIKDEWQWERETLQDLNLDPEQEDPRSAAADDVKYAPESKAMSAEQVTQLNQLRVELKAMLADSSQPREPLVVVDCMFGLGLTEKSKAGIELTMREVCDLLQIAGETQARKIARCQVLLDKGLDMIRSQVRKKLPGVADCWQADINVNTASRRELSHQLSLTEGEVERLLANRQYYCLTELVDAGVVKANRLEEIAKNGAVAAFVPLEVNSCTTRDLIDILGLPKEMAQKFAAKRPFASFDEAIRAQVLTQAILTEAVRRGAALKPPSTGDQRLDLNSTEGENLTTLGLAGQMVERIMRGRPFATWAELEEYLSPDNREWLILRQKTCLGISD